MATLNKIMLIGNVGDEPKMTTTNSGNKVVNFSVATTMKGFKKADGTTTEDKTDWHNCIAWGKLAEIIGQYVKKGASIYVEGEMHYRKYDAKDGSSRTASEITITAMQMLDRKPSQEN